MAYLDDDFAWDEGLRTIIESNGDDGWEPAGSGEAVGPRYRRQGGAQRRPAPRPSPARPVGGLGGATIDTPAGRAQVKFEKPLATKEAVDELAKELKREIAATAEAIKRIDSAVDKNTSILDNKVAAIEALVKKGQQSSQMGFLLPLLLTKPPEIETLRVKTGTTESTLTVTDTTFKKDDNFGLLLAIMSMSGGLGGGGGNDSMNPMMLLALTGAFK